MNSIRLSWLGLAFGLLAVASAQGRPVPLLKSGARSSAGLPIQLVGSGVYAATGSSCYPNSPTHPLIAPVDQNPGIPGSVLTAPIVVGVLWPWAGYSAAPVHELFGDFVTDLLHGPYWDATMPQYAGSAHGAVQARVDLPSLLTMQPGATVRAWLIAGELLAQQQAGVLPAPDPALNKIYVVHIPPGVTVTDSSDGTHISIGSSCVSFRAYHDSHMGW